MIKAIAFDLDNTLIDFTTFKKETAKSAAKAMVKAGLKANTKIITKQIFETYDEYGIEYQKTIGKVMWNNYKFKDYNKFEKIQQAGIIAYQKRKFKVLKPYPDVLPTLKKLKKKYKLCLVTDAPRNKAWQRMILTGLEDMFDTVITLDDTKKFKPSALPFKALLRKIKLKPEEVLFIGDSPNRDIKGAKNLGMKTALAQYGQVFKGKTKPDHYLKSFKGLLKII